MLRRASIRGGVVTVTVTVGKELAHPNTTEHHIRWIQVYFMPKGEKFAVHLGRFEFDAHGESAQGPNTSTVYTSPSVTFNFKSEKSGTIVAGSYCNIHGLWNNEKEIGVA
jgi:superoxide reductase